ncbi:MAG: glycosyltransferase family 39 protein [Anaerolineales bacterium]
MNRPPLRMLLILLLLALAPRLALAIAYRQEPIALDDMFQYDMLARSLVDGNGYRWYQRADVDMLRPYLESLFDFELPNEDVPEEGFVTTFRPPGYPFFLAGIYALNGLEGRFAAARIVQSLISALMAPLAALIAWRLGLSKRAGWWAGITVALYPILWMYPIGLASENLFMPLLALSVLGLLWAGEDRRWWAGLLAGLALGAAALTRGALAPFLPLAAIWLWRRSGLRAAVILTAATSAVLVPWMVRNSLILNKPSFVDNSAGYNLFVGYHPEGDGSFVSEVAVLPMHILDDGARDQWARQQAAAFIRQDPGRAAGLSLRRLAYFFSFEDRELMYFYGNNFFGAIPQPWLALAFLFLVLPWVAIALSAPFGMASAPGPGRSLILALVGSALIAYVPILAEARFHLPLVPFVAAYAGAAWSTPSLGPRLRAGLRNRELALWLACAAALILLALWAWDLAYGWSRLQALMAPGGNRLWIAY